MEKIKSFASDNVEFLGFASDEVLLDYMQRAKCFVFAAEEDFGIVPVEAQACGTPVICLGKGGTKETVIDGVTGVHFEEQTVASLSKAIEKFEDNTFSSQEIREHSLKFSKERFEKEIEEFVNEKYEIFKKERL
jgi:glycosyltransferase involved in cell wall biosynthesis